MLLDGTSTIINSLAAAIDGNGKAASEEVDSFQRGSYYMTPVDCMSNLNVGLFTDVRDATMRVLKVEDSNMTQRKPVNVTSYAVQCENYFDWHQTAMRRQNDAVFTDYAGEQKLSPENDLSVILSTGMVEMQAWYDYFRANDGKSRPIRNYLIDDTDPEKSAIPSHG